MQDTLLVAFQGEPMCFVHVLLNALDIEERGAKARIILEGMSPNLVDALEKKENPFHQLWMQAREQGLVAGACRACSSKIGALAAVEAAGVPLLDGMSGHPPLGEWTEKGFAVLTF